MYVKVGRDENNFYLYRFENKDLFQFIPWDKSEAFKGGVDYDNKKALFPGPFQ